MFYKHVTVTMWEYITYNDTADTHSLQTKLLGTLKTRRKLGRVFSQRFLGILLGQEKNTGRQSGTSPVTTPETTAGHNSAPFLFSFLKWRIVFKNKSSLRLTIFASWGTFQRVYEHFLDSWIEKQ